MGRVSTLTAMAVVLAYVDAVPGRLYPLVPTLQELRRRGHRVAVRCGKDDVELLRSTGLAAESLAREIAACGRGLDGIGVPSSGARPDASSSDRTAGARVAQASAGVSVVPTQPDGGPAVHGFSMGGQDSNLRPTDYEWRQNRSRKQSLAGLELRRSEDIQGVWWSWGQISGQSFGRRVRAREARRGKRSRCDLPLRFVDESSRDPSHVVSAALAGDGQGL